MSQSPLPTPAGPDRSLREEPDVVAGRDYDRAIAALKDILDAAERAQAGFPIESEEWYARRDYARIIVREADGDV